MSMSITSPAVAVERASGSTGARIRGVDLNALEDDTFATIHQALLEHGVVHLPGQDVTPEAHKAFGERFGALHTHPAAPGVHGHPEILLLENRGKSNTITEVWHSDVTCEAKPPAISILAARTLPDAGGDTMWANQYLAHDRLSDGMKAMLDGMRAVHKGFGLEAVHPVIRTHPETGRKALFVNGGFTSHFENMTKAESKPLLDHLVAFASTPDLTYRHSWSAGDVVLWDNRGVMHFAVHDHEHQHRVMHRVTVTGDEPR
jgi:taurine dioxygenase